MKRAMKADTRELCRTTTLPHPDHIAPDIESFLEDHFVTYDGRCLPSPEEPWNLTFNMRRDGRLKCGACGNLPRGDVLVGMRHRRATNELWCCRLCSFKLNGAAPAVIATEAAKPENGETAICRRYMERLRDLSKWAESPAPAMQIIDPDEHARVVVAPHADGWEWRVQMRFSADDRETIVGTARTIEAAYSEAGWAWMAADRVRLLMDRDRPDEPHAFACEIAGLEDLARMAGDGLRPVPGELLLGNGDPK